MTEVAEKAVAGSKNSIRDHVDLASMMLATLAFFAGVSIIVSYALWFCLP